MQRSATPDPALKPEPLYQRVREVLVRRIADGTWGPGSLLPSEHEIAAELGVSQGTVRKSLDAMTDEKLLVRRQGRGTFVAKHDTDRVLFQFFKLTADDGLRQMPNSRVLSVKGGPATDSEAKRLSLRRGARVIRIDRVRTLDRGPPIISERIVLPAALFPGLASEPALPNNLYGLYSTRYGVIIARAAERLKAVAAGATDAKRLNIKPGTPLLEIDRIAIDLDGRAVEWRVSRCVTTGHFYESDLK